MRRRLETLARMSPLAPGFKDEVLAVLTDLVAWIERVEADGQKD